MKLRSFRNINMVNELNKIKYDSPISAFEWNCSVFKTNM